MTNRTLPDHGAALSPEFLALAPVGGKRRTPKVVDLPVFRAARARLDQPYIVLRLPVASLNRAARAQSCLRRAAARTLALTTQEAS